MNDYQAELVAAGKRFRMNIAPEKYPDGNVHITCDKPGIDFHRHAYTEAEAVVVGQMLLKGAAELARRRREAQTDGRITTTSDSE